MKRSHLDDAGSGCGRDGGAVLRLTAGVPQRSLVRFLMRACVAVALTAGVVGASIVAPPEAQALPSEEEAGALAIIAMEEARCRDSISGTIGPIDIDLEFGFISDITGNVGRSRVRVDTDSFLHDYYGTIGRDSVRIDTDSFLYDYSGSVGSSRIRIDTDSFLYDISGSIGSEQVRLSTDSFIYDISGTFGGDSVRLECDRLFSGGGGAPAPAPTPAPEPAPTAVPAPTTDGLSINLNTKRKGFGRPTAAFNGDNVTVTMKTKLKSRSRYSIEVLGPHTESGVCVEKPGVGCEYRAYRNVSTAKVSKKRNLDFTVTVSPYSEIWLRDSKDKIFARFYVTPFCSADSSIQLACTTSP